MPQKKAALKAMRQNQKRYAKNSRIRKKIKDLKKKADKLLGAKKIDDARAVYQELQKVLDKASKSGGFLKKNTTSRYKSRLLKKIHTYEKK